MVQKATFLYVFFPIDYQLLINIFSNYVSQLTFLVPMASKQPQSGLYLAA